MAPLGISAEGMAVQQSFLDAIASNLANAETTRTPEGGPYQRRVISATQDQKTGQVATQSIQDPRPGRLVYDPGHPDANTQGFVQYPNVDATRELVDLMIVRRVFEANASVFQAAKAMLRRALEI